MIACPHCNCLKIIKYGKFNNIQRFKCKNHTCNKTFSSTTNTTFSYSKLSTKTIKNYIAYMDSGLSIRECAKKSNVSSVTSFFLRHKILESRSMLLKETPLREYVEGMKIILPDTIKSKSSTCNINNEICKKRIFIFSLMDINGHIKIIPIRKYALSFIDIKNLIIPKLDSNAYVQSYGDRFLNLISKDKSSYNSDNKKFILSFTSNIKNWLKRFNGISSKYILNYLNWYICKYKNLLFNLENILYIKKYIRNHDFKNYDSCY